MTLTDGRETMIVLRQQSAPGNLVGAGAPVVLLSVPSAESKWRQPAWGCLKAGGGPLSLRQPTTWRTAEGVWKHGSRPAPYLEETVKSTQGGSSSSMVSGRSTLFDQRNDIWLKKDIQNHIHKAAARMTHQDCLSAALAAIDTIPEQVGDILQYKANNLAKTVQTELTVMRTVIRRSEACEAAIAERAVARLEPIPDMILNSFEDKLDKCRTTVRQRVNGKIQELKKTDLGYDEIVKELWTIPEEVHQIAGEAVEEAVLESQAQTKRQLDFALQSLPQDALLETTDQKNSDAGGGTPLWAVKMQIMEQVPGVGPEMLPAAFNTAQHNVSHAVAAVDGTIPNRLVASALFHAKTGHLNDSKSQASEASKTRDQDGQLRNGSRACSSSSSLRNVPTEGQPPLVVQSQEQTRDIHTGGNASERSSSSLDPGDGQPSLAVPNPEHGTHTDLSLNPGSVGHPELCARPCLYFQAGRCTNGFACKFCHREHAQRVVHLGRRHRKLLESLPFAEAVSITLPVLRQKLMSTCLSLDVLKVLATLSRQSQRPAAAQIRPRDAKTLEKALGALTVRSLFMTLRTMVARGSQEQATLEAILQQLRFEGYCLDTCNLAESGGGLCL